MASKTVSDAFQMGIDNKQDNPIDESYVDSMSEAMKEMQEEDKKDKSNICAIKIAQLVEDIETGAENIVFNDIDKLPPKHAYKGGNVEFMFEDKTFTDKLAVYIKEHDIKLKIPPTAKHGSLIYADLMELKENQATLDTLQFKGTEIANDLRNIKKGLSEAFVTFQRDRFSALNEPGTDDTEACRRSLLNLTQKIPEIAGNHARLQVMLQGTELERDIASAAIMETWSTAMAQYRADIDADIDKLKPEQLEKIAENLRKKAEDKLYKASHSVENLVSDYQNDLGLIFLGSFCGPLFIIAVLPFVLPYLFALNDQSKADVAIAKSVEQYKQIDQKIEIAAALTSSRKVVEDWIQYSVAGNLPSLTKQLSDPQSDYMKNSHKRFCEIRDIITPLEKANFTKEFEAGSPEEQAFKAECFNAASLINSIKSEKIPVDMSEEIYLKALHRIDNIAKITKGDKNDVFNKSNNISEKILALVNGVSKETSQTNILGTSLFDSYKSTAVNDFGSGGVNIDPEKGDNSSLTRKQMRMYIENKIKLNIPDLSKNNKELDGMMQNKILNDKISNNAVDIDMALRCMVSHDTTLTRRNPDSPKSGLDFLDAAFGFEHSTELAKDTFWGQLKEYNYSPEDIESFKRLLIASAMAESYKSQYIAIANNGIENTYGAYHVFDYYTLAVNDIEEMKEKLGENKIKDFADISEKISSESATKPDYNKEEHSRLEMEYKIAKQQSQLYKQEVDAFGNEKDIPADKTKEYETKFNEWKLREKEEERTKIDAGVYMAKHLGVHQATEITAITASKYAQIALDKNSYALDNIDIDKDTIRRRAYGALKNFFNPSNINKTLESMKAVEGTGNEGMPPSMVNEFTALSLAGNQSLLNESIGKVMEYTVGENNRNQNSGKNKGKEKGYIDSFIDNEL